MALTDEMNNTGMVMPVAPMYGNGGNGGFGFGDGNGFWIILLFILLGGWGNGFGGGYGNGAIANDAAVMYPWMNQSNQINGGFRDQMLNTTINGIQNAVTTGFGDVQNALCSGFGSVNMNLANGFAGVNANLSNGFAGVNAGIANGFAQAEIANNARQIADMQQNFAAQTATIQGFNGVQSQLAQCCCDNRAATADLKYTVATENCADRTAAMQNTRDIIDAQTRGTQAILDKLCALELDGVKGQLAAAQRENVGLQNQLNIATMQASQAAQNAFIQQGFSNEVDALYNRLNTCPVPTTPVYGRTPIFTCGNQGCGCGGVA
jgi:hypothetical protein